MSDHAKPPHSTRRHRHHLDNPDTAPDYTDPQTAAGKHRRRAISVGPFEFHPVVFPAAVAIIVTLIAAAIGFGQSVETLFDDINALITNTFGWLYILTLSGFLVFSLWLGFGPYGHIPLGKDGEKPEFNRLTWFAMLFSAGMGIGLLFWGVAEPLSHYNAPPGDRAGATFDSAQDAMALTIFHWGLHPWALYAIVALTLAYFGFRRGMPLSFRSVFYPLFGDRVHGLLGDVIDILAVVSTLFGVATSLGLGASQVNAGLNHLLGIDMSTITQVILIAGITAVATVSVVLGLHVGIRRLSEANMTMAALLLVFVFLFGPTTFLLNAFVENIGTYLQKLPVNSFWTATFDADDGRDWLGSWTVYYWGWWIAWSPFVGMFIARVSRGRTIREFVTGVLLVPTIVGAVWLTIFGNTAIHQDLAANRPDAVQTTYRLAEVPVIQTVPAGPDGDHTLRLNQDQMAVGPDNNLYSPNPERRTVTAADGTELRLATVNGTTALVPANADPAGVTPYTAPADAPEANGLFATDTEPVTPAQYLAGGVAAAAGQPLSYDERVSTVLFIMLEPLPLVAITASIATLCIVLFFVTSSDSASMVIDIIATGGNPDPPVGTRLFWAISEGVVAAVLLLAGGLQALQTASITAALPFTFVLILMCVSLFRALSADEMTRFQRNRQRAVSAAERAAERTAEEYLEENLDTTARAGT